MWEIVVKGEVVATVKSKEDAFLLRKWSDNCYRGEIREKEMVTKVVPEPVKETEKAE